MQNLESMNQCQMYRSSMRPKQLMSFCLHIALHKSEEIISLASEWQNVTKQRFY